MQTKTDHAITWHYLCFLFCRAEWLWASKCVRKI